MSGQHDRVESPSSSGIVVSLYCVSKATATHELEYIKICQLLIIERLVVRRHFLKAREHLPEDTGPIRAVSSSFPTKVA